jgi:hypothetical protein
MVRHSIESDKTAPYENKQFWPLALYIAQVTSDSHCFVIYTSSTNALYNSILVLQDYKLLSVQFTKKLPDIEVPSKVRGEALQDPKLTMTLMTRF